jgi:Flp pilus assembly CpaF family ATPase
MALDRCAILLTGRGGTGKTTLATALLGAAPSSARIITIEEVAELNPTSHHLEKLLLQRPAPSGATARDLVEVALQRLPQWIALGDLSRGQSPALLRALEGESSCLITAQAICEHTALQMILDDLRAELPRTPSDELAARLNAGVDLAIVMGSSEGRPYIEALRERSAEDPRSFIDIVRFEGEANGKRIWRLINPESSWVRTLRERGHELRVGPGLLPAT